MERRQTFNSLHAHWREVALVINSNSYFVHNSPLAETFKLSSSNRTRQLKVHANGELLLSATSFRAAAFCKRKKNVFTSGHQASAIYFIGTHPLLLYHFMETS